MGEVVEFPRREPPDLTDAEYLALVLQKQREAEAAARHPRGVCSGD